MTPSTPASGFVFHELSHTQWFMEEVQPHEPALRAYLRARFPALTDIDDLVQETFARMLRARESTGVRAPKSLLFSTARNAALDILRRNRVVQIENLAN